MSKMRSLACLLALSAFASCSFKVPAGQVRVSIELPRERTGLTLWRPELERLIPSTYADMDCYFLNVNGPGIEDDRSGSGRELSFLDLGITSGLAAAGEGSVSMRVPAGLARTIQVLGISGNPSLLGQCAGKDVKNLLITAQPSLFEIGRVTSALYQDSTVSVQQAYSSSSAYDLMSPYVGNLALNQGYQGSSVLGTINSYAGGLPPSGMAEIADTAAFSRLQDPTRTGGLAYALPPPGAGSLFARLDFAFSIGSAALSRYSSFSVTGKVGGGTSAYAAGSCGAATANGGILLAAWNARLQTWSTPVTITATAPSDISPGLSLPLSSDYLETTGGRTYIHVTLFSQDAATPGGATCSNLLVNQLRVTLGN